MRIGVIGAGPVGGILAAHLARAGEEVCVVDVDPGLLAAARERGIEVTGPAAEKVAGPFTARVADACADFSAAGRFDAVFVCVKTTAEEAVAAALKKAWRGGTVLVSFQNGIDPEDVLAGVAGEEHTLRVIVNYAGHMVEPGVYSLNWFTPPNFIGALNEKGRPHQDVVAKLLCDARLTTAAVDDVKKYAYEKTALNAALSPVCALTGQTMGEAMALPETRRLVVELLREARAVAAKRGWAFDHTVDDWLRYLEAGGAHRPSMAKDVDAGRRTEIASMNGKICELGGRLGVPTPYNYAMTWAILGRERVAGRSLSSPL